jgi:hypothetical protein
MATKKAKRKSKPAPKAVLAAAVVPQRMYHCRCYKIGDGYEMWYSTQPVGRIGGLSRVRCSNVGLAILLRPKWLEVEA